MNILKKISLKPLLFLFSILAFLGIGGYVLFRFYPSVVSTSFSNVRSLFGASQPLSLTTRTPDQIQQSVLAATQSSTLTGTVDFNIPVIFNDVVTFKKDGVFDGNLGVTGQLSVADLLVNGKSITGVGSSTPLAGSGITISAGTVPTIINTGVTSFGGQTGNVVLTGSGGISVNGTSITNTDPGSAQNIFKTIIVGNNTIAATSNTDSLTFAGGTGIVVSSSGKTVTIAGAQQSGFIENSGGIFQTTSTDSVNLGTSSASLFKLQVAGDIGPS